MKSKKILVPLLALVAVGAVGAYLLLSWLLGDTQAASAPITAIPLAAAQTETTPSGVYPAPEQGASSASYPAPGQEPTSGATLFTINSAESEARFSIYEELGGQPKTVVGVTDQIAGEILVDLNNLAAAQLGIVQVNARTLVTDNDNRNRAIRNFILNTDTYEFITFTPTAISGLSGGAQPGQDFSFQITGDLTIRDVTQPVTFTVSGSVVSATRLEGTATAVVQRGPYNLIIPSVPRVANVGEDVTIELELVIVAEGG